MLRLSFLVLPVLAVHCNHDPLTPVAPTWDVDLTVPLTDRTLTLGEMIERDTSLIHIGAGQALVFSQDASVPPMYVGNRIALAPTYGTARMQLGGFHVSVAPATTSMNVPGLTPGATMPIPSSSFAIPDVPNAMPASSTVRCESGTIGMTIRNNLPVEVIGTSPILLVDAQGSMQATFQFTDVAIPPRGSRTVFDSLADRTLGDGASLTGLNFRTPGTGAAVAIPADSMLIASVHVNNLHVSEARLSSLPAQQLTENERLTIQIEDSTIIQEARIMSGRLGMEFRNKIGLAILLKFRLPEFWRSVGGRLVQLEDSIYLSPMGEAFYDVDLAGCRISSATGGLLPSMELVSSVVIPADVNHAVQLHDTDNVELSMATLAPIVVDSMTAVLKPTWIDLDTSVPLVLGEVPEKFKWQLLIPSASLVLETRSTVLCPSDLYLSLSARSAGAGQTVSLQVPASQRRLSGGQGIITFDEAEVGRFLSQFPGGLPDSIRISGKVLVNPPDAYVSGPGGISSIGSNCSFSGRVHLNIPLKVGFGGQIYCDTLAVGDADQHPPASVTEGVNNGQVMLELVNGLPMQVGVRLRLLDYLRNPIITIPQSGQPVQIVSASVNALGDVVIPARSRAVITLDHAEAQLICPAEYVEYTFDLSTSLGSPAVAFRTTDYIHVRCWSEISYGVNK